jgi:hypothetical protein
MAYLTFTDYQMYGGSLDEAAFSRYEFRARQMIDQLTHGRIRNDSPQREAVKRAMVELIGRQARDAAHDGREIASMGNDGLSVSYAAAGAGGAQARCVDIICEYLINETTGEGVPLLYAGVDA